MGRFPSYPVGGAHIGGSTDPQGNRHPAHGPRLLHPSRLASGLRALARRPAARDEDERRAPARARILDARRVRRPSPL